MAIRLLSLLNYARSGRMYKMAGMSLGDAQRRYLKTAFLSHSHKDRIYAKGVEAWLKENGLDVYIDWEDEEMPEIPDKTTAERIQKKSKTVICSCIWQLKILPNQGGVLGRLGTLMKQRGKITFILFLQQVMTGL